jgi:ribosome-interacting GTPase 1
MLRILTLLLIPIHLHHHQRVLIPRRKDVQIRALLKHLHNKLHLYRIYYLRL